MLVEPKHEGNIGSIARLMKNFGLSEFWLVNPKVDIGVQARSLASHAENIIEKAITVKNLHDAFFGVGYVVGTTSISAKASSNILRTTITPQEFASNACTVNETIALLLGRESTGLSNEELNKCDVIVTIPSNPAYRTLNIASAASIIFYELWKTKLANKRGYVEEANRVYRERILMLFGQICQLNLPSHKERLTKRAFKNVISRAFISKREATLIMGAFRQLIQSTS